MKAYLPVAVCALVVGMATTASAQILDVEINNGVFYVYDSTDRSGFAASPAVVPPWSGGPSPLNFFKGVFIADIVSVNGQPARGVMVRRGTRVGLTTNQVPGQAIADTTRGFIDDGVWEIQTAEGTAVGTFTTAPWRALCVLALVTEPDNDPVAGVWAWLAKTARMRQAQRLVADRNSRAKA